jgi:predicted nucleic acid-binding protein
VTDWENARPQDVRDAKHLYTAIRFGMAAFVTLDENFHRKADQLGRHIRVWPPGRPLK